MQCDNSQSISNCMPVAALQNPMCSLRTSAAQAVAQHKTPGRAGQSASQVATAMSGGAMPSPATAAADAQTLVIRPSGDGMTASLSPAPAIQHAPLPILPADGVLLLVPLHLHAFSACNLCNLHAMLTQCAAACFVCHTSRWIPACLAMQW